MYASFNSIAFFYYRQFDVLVWSWFSHYDSKDIFFLYMIWKTLLILWLRYKTLNCFPNEWKSLIITLHHVKRDDQLNIGCVYSCRQAGRLNRPTAWQKKQNCIIRMAQVNWRWNLSLFLFHFCFLVVILCQFDQVTS